MHVHRDFGYLKSLLWALQIRQWRVGKQAGSSPHRWCCFCSTEGAATTGDRGTYISFLAGNISNMRLPVSAVAQEAAGVREGSPEGEIIGGIGISVSQVMLTIAVLAGAVVVTLIIDVLPKNIKGAFDFLLPCLWGAIVGQFALRAPQYAIVALIVGVPLVMFSGLPDWTQIPVMVFGLAILAILLFKRGIWVPKK